MGNVRNTTGKIFTFNSLLLLEDRQTSVWSKEFEDINAHNVLSKLNTLTVVFLHNLHFLLGFRAARNFEGQQWSLNG